MATQISIFNHKGGVGKTTTAFHLGWKLAELGKRVILADFDPQCNLTGILLSYRGDEQYPFVGTAGNKYKNIKDALSPTFEGRPIPLEPVDLAEVTDREGLFVLPGHVGLAEYESALAISHELSGSLQALQNLPGSFRHLLKITAAEYNIDYILVDMSPSLGAINQNLLMTSDGFIVPTAPDYFSGMALRSLARILPKWAAWSKRAAENESLNSATYPWPNVNPIYFGSIVQNYRRRSTEGEPAKPTKAYQRWFEELTDVLNDTLVPELTRAGLTLNEALYQKADVGTFLMEVPDFNSLIAISQDRSKPVFTLTKDDIGTSGFVLRNQTQNVDNFNKIYATGAQKLIRLVDSKNDT